MFCCQTKEQLQKRLISCDVLTGKQKIFVSGTDNPQPCPVGHYCLMGNGTTPCPRLTYRDTPGAAVITDCHPCVAGYWCNYTGEW